MELAFIIVLGLIALAVIALAAVAVVAALRARAGVEQAWHTIYVQQTAHISALQNRVLSHRWEEFHNLQVTPSEIDVAQRGLPDFPTNGHETSEDFEEQLAEALRAGGADLEGPSWSPTVG